LSFRSQSCRDQGILQAHDRLRSPGQQLAEIGHDPETFIFVIQVESTGEICGTAYATRYQGVEEWPEGPGERTWERLGVEASGIEAWELHMMAVHPNFQRQGLADYLLKITDREILRRCGPAVGVKRVMLISTVKETNERFYTRKGFVLDYAVKWPDGHRDSKAFTVIHMRREIKASEDCD